MSCLNIEGVGIVPLNSSRATDIARSSPKYWEKLKRQILKNDLRVKVKRLLNGICKKKILFNAVENVVACRLLEKWPQLWIWAYSLSQVSEKPSDHAWKESVAMAVCGENRLASLRKGIKRPKGDARLSESVQRPQWQLCPILPSSFAMLFHVHFRDQVPSLPLPPLLPPLEVGGAGRWAMGRRTYWFFGGTSFLKLQNFSKCMRYSSLRLSFLCEYFN